MLMLTRQHASILTDSVYVYLLINAIESGADAHVIDSGHLSDVVYVRCLHTHTHTRARRHTQTDG